MKTYSDLWFPVSIAVMIQTIFVVSGVSPALEGRLFGPDAYMWLVRVTELVANGDWLDTISARSNAPYGERLHWTHPFDLLLLAGAAPLTPFLGFRSALYWWGVLISPALELATLAALFWAGKVFFERRGRVFLAVIFVCQPGVFHAFMAGRPDHQSLQSLLFLLSVGFTLYLIRDELRPRLCMGAGALAAFAMWVSVESLVMTFLMVAALGLFWIWHGGDFAKKNQLFAVVLAAGSALAWIVDPPGQGLMTQLYDRLSVVQVTLFVLVAMFWAVIVGLEARAGASFGRRRRLLLGGAGIVVILGLARVAFPELFAGPYADVDSRVQTIFLDTIGQRQPLTRGPATVVGFWFGAVVLGVPYLIYRCLRGRGRERQLWLYLAGALVLYMPFVFYQMRWSTYPGLFLTIPLTGLLMAVLAFLDRRLVFPWQSVARAFTVTLFSVGFLFIGLMLQRGAQDFAGLEKMQRKKTVCSLGGFARFANARDTGQGAPERIVASPFSGPEILYRTRHEVVATSFHRNTSGVLDVYAIFSATGDEAARQLIERRGVTWLLLCVNSAEPYLYAPAEGPSTLYGRLTRGQGPPWLRPMELPSELAGFRLFEVAA